MKTYIDNVLEEFREGFTKDGVWIAPNMKSGYIEPFIEQKIQEALYQQKQNLIKKLEGEKGEWLTKFDKQWFSGYNQALDRAIEIIKEE